MSTVLVVDDDVDIARFIEVNLKLEGFDVIVANDGEQALEAINERMPDLVLLDVQMPHKNGFEVLEAIDLERPPILIFITAWDSYALRAFEVSALDFLLKPFDTVHEGAQMFFCEAGFCHERTLERIGAAETSPPGPYRQAPTL